MKRVPIFQMASSSIITKSLPLDIQINGGNITPINPDSNSLLIPSDNNTVQTTTTTTTTTTNNIIQSDNSNTKFEHKCNTCSMIFNDKDTRNSHYRSGLHRYNLKLKLSHLPSVSELEYGELVEEMKKGSEKKQKNLGDNESDSSDSETSSSESDEDIENENILLQQGYQFTDNFIEYNDPKVKIISKDLKLQLSVWKCILANPEVFKQLYQQKNDSHYQASKGIYLLNEFKSIATSSVGKLKWAVLLCSGGRFAGSINIQGQCLEHKAFHRYTTRKKQGGSQSKSDSQGQTKHSAGAGIRRYNEKRLKEEIEALLLQWKPHLEQCNYIFVFAPKGNTRDIIFPPNGWLSPNDERVRNIPFPIIRPIFSETQRVSTLLFSVDIELINEEKEEIERKVHEEERTQEERARLEREEIKRLKEEKEKEIKEIENRYRNDPLFEAVRNRDFKTLKELLELDESYDLPEPSQNDSIITPLYLAVINKDMEMIKYLLTMLPGDINTCIPEFGFKTILHKASEQGNEELIELLLDRGADPTIAEGLVKETAYDCSQNQKTRDFFREWAGTHLEKWDYHKAHIIPLTPQMKEEKEEKKKLERKKKKEKEKVKKQKEKQEKQESIKKEGEIKKKMDDLKLVDQMAKDKLVKESKLTEREKRALAAESRLSGSTKKCGFCQSNIPGIPFERLDFIYCSTKCVLEHKKKLLFE